MKLGGPTSKESVGADDDDKINKITKEYPLVMECDLKYTNNKNLQERNFGLTRRRQFKRYRIISS